MVGLSRKIGAANMSGGKSVMTADNVNSLQSDSKYQAPIKGDPDKRGLINEVDAKTRGTKCSCNGGWVSYKSKSKKIWDFSVLLVAIFNSLVIPFEQAFKAKIFKEPAFEAVDYVIDLIFLLDVILTFQTSFMDKKGQECFGC